MICAAWAAAPPAARGASFACGPGNARVEQMICADDALSRLDDRLAAAFTRSVAAFGNSPDDAEGVVADLRKSQKTWLAARDSCADRDCVARQYRARTAVLEFHGRPGATGWVDAIAGEYHHDRFMTLWIQVRDSDSVRVAFSGAEPRSAQWICDFVGFGTRDNGDTIEIRLSVSGGEVLLVMRRASGAIDVPDTPLNQSASENYCGMGGTLIWRYDPK
jgi:uncharacterized protein YecT (DUF1311 family)